MNFTEIGVLNGTLEEELLKARDKKRKERGGFKEGIVLNSVRNKE
ncbi:hypothetical protein [Clostridium beijerinckii]|nr:hypothetical protein [Clostridium beijerinckii]